MNNCSWYLWLSGSRIYNIRQLRENFDTALLTGYFLGGSLMKWLSDLGEYEIIRRLSTIDLGGDIGRQLEFAFGVSPDKKPEMPAPDPADGPGPVITVPAESIQTGDTAVYTGSFFGLPSVSSFAAATESSFTAAVLGSFTALSESSFNSVIGNALSALSASSFSSFNLSSYSAFVSGQALSIASSAFSSSAGSFSLLFGQHWLNSGKYGSFTLSSFSYGSFAWLFGKYGRLIGSSGGSYYGSFLLALHGKLGVYGNGSGSYGSFGNIHDFFGEGSFRYNAAGITITAEEYHRTLINLSSCPLNAYGYGINLV